MKIVEATSVKDYLDRYYKKSKMTLTLLQSYQEEFERNGYICTSHHDNVMGEFIAWPDYPRHLIHPKVEIEEV
jgi:hypothetical protein